MIYTSLPIDSAFLDVDFIRGADDIGRMRGMLPTSDALFGSTKPYGASNVLYPEDRWADMIAQKDAEKSWLSMRITTAFDQGNTSSCVYNAAALAHQLIWNLQFGDEDQVPLSPMSGYRWNADSVNSGSTVGGALEWLKKTGLLPWNLDANLRRVPHDFQHTFPPNNWSAPFPSGWKETAKMFRADEYFSVKTIQEWVSAILNGFVCVGGRDGHAILHCRLAMDGGKLFSVYCNSWGPWGATLETAAGPLKSFGYDSRDKIATMVARDGWAIRSVVRPQFLRR